MRGMDGWRGKRASERASLSHLFFGGVGGRLPFPAFSRPFECQGLQSIMEGGKEKRVTVRLPASMKVAEDGRLVLKRPLAAGALILAIEGEEEETLLSDDKISLLPEPTEEVSNFPSCHHVSCLV